MQLPFVCKTHISDREFDNWRLRFSRHFGYDRSIRENVWRRHQDFSNRELSGWRSAADARRRVVHFRDQYGLRDRSFVLTKPYLFMHLKLPSSELRRYYEHLCSNLEVGGWSETGHQKASDAGRRFLRGDMQCVLKLYSRCRFDERYRVTATKGYAYLDVVVRATAFAPSWQVVERPWTALAAGIRRHNPRGIPKVVDVPSIARWLPAQVELGCGPSIEAGIPPLNSLHHIYSILTPTKRFVMGVDDDRLCDLFREPEAKYEEAATMHVACLTADVTDFYTTLKRLASDGRVVGPVLTNNFDGLALSAGLKELPLRRFDRNYRYPVMAFHPAARSLLVIGSHADRRNVQASARRQGLQIIFVDPEGYRAGEQFTPYPLEAPQDEDMLVRLRAGEFITRLATI